MNIKNKTDDFMRISSEAIINHLKRMFFEVKRFLDVKGHAMVEEFAKNPRKDDVTLRFDYKAEEIAVRYLRRNLKFPVKILTEERGIIMTRGGDPLLTFIIDPVDGSENYKRKIECTAFSAAVIPSNKPVALKNVEVALVGSVWSGNVFYAIKGKGAYYNGRRIFGSKVRELSEALIGIDLDFNIAEKWKWQRIMPVIEKSRMIRRGGAASLDITYVAMGAYDAMIDVRDKLTPENFMAAYLIVKEAGGVFTDPFGNELPEKLSISETYNLVASGNKRLHKKIIETLNMTR